MQHVIMQQHRTDCREDIHNYILFLHSKFGFTFPPTYAAQLTLAEAYKLCIAHVYSLAGFMILAKPMRHYGSFIDDPKLQPLAL